MVYSNNGEHKERLIAPLGLVAKRGVWYVAAQCGGEMRTYRVSRITEARMTGEAFIRPAGFDLAHYWEESTASFKAALPRYPVTLLLSSSGLNDLQRERYVTILTVQQSSRADWVEVQAEFNTLESACKIILSLGQTAMVAEPRELLDRLITALRETCVLYEKVTQNYPSGEMEF